MIKIRPKDTQLEEIARQAIPGDKRNADSLPDNGGLFNGGKEPPIRVKPQLKQDAATKVLQEGVTNEDHGADAAMAKLPHINIPGDNT